MTNKEIDELIDSYGSHNSSLNSLKKTCTEESDKIKDFMRKGKLGVLESDSYKLSLSERQSESMDESRLLEVLKADWANRYGNIECPYIKSVEVVDMDVLASVMYNNEIPQETLAEMDKCRTVKTTYALRCKAIKGEE